MATNTQGPVDAEISSNKLILSQLDIKIKGFTAAYPNMIAKDRARNILEIQKTFETLTRFFDKLKGANIQNTGTRFAADNLRQSFYSLQDRWRKFENSLNLTKAG
jgi:hypothetical protein